MASLRLDVTVPLRDFDLRVALDTDAETVAIVGPSGAGKSTLLRAVAGLVPCDGSVVVNGKDWSGLAPERRAVGFVFQDYAFFPHLTVRGNVAFGGARPATCSSGSGSPTLRTRGPESCRAASGSASPSPVRSRESRRCCCSTSRSARSIRTRATRCGQSCVRRCASWRCPRSW